MTAIKPRRAIAPTARDNVFTDATIRELASELLACADFEEFARGFREAALAYTTAVATPSRNAVIEEIKRLGSAADQRRFSAVARALSALSPAARAKLDETRQLFRMTVAIPSADELSDPQLRDKACESLVTVCHFGGRMTYGRMRPTGRRFRMWQPILSCGEKEKRPPRRDAEIYFLRDLRLAYHTASGRDAPWTAHPVKPGPFARMVQKALPLVGASGCDAVELINEWNERRKAVQQAHDADLSVRKP